MDWFSRVKHFNDIMPIKVGEMVIALALANGGVSYV